MKLFLQFIICSIYSHYSFSQKALIDTSLYNKWPSVGNQAAVTNDGKYVLYNIKLGDNFSKSYSDLVIQSIDNNWKLQIPDVILSKAYFTQNSKFCVFVDAKNMLQIVTLGTSKAEHISNTISFKVPDYGEWLAYEISDTSRKLILYNLRTKEQKYFKDVYKYLFSEDGEVLVIYTNIENDTNTQFVKWINIQDGSINTIWELETPRSSNIKINIDDFTFNNNFNKLLFKVEKEFENKKENSFWYYTMGADKAVMVVNNQSVGLGSDLKLQNIICFGKDDTKFFINLIERDLPPGKVEAARVNIWSYTDVTLQSDQLNNLDPKKYIGVVQIKGSAIFRLEDKYEMVRTVFNLDGRGDNYLLISTSRKGNGEVNYNERHWNKTLKQTVYIISTRDGKRKRIKELEEDNLRDWSISPGEKYVIYYDGKQGNYFTYEISTGILRNISKGITTKWTIYGNDHVNASNSSYSPAGWLKNDAAVLLYDQYDIWQVDPIGIKPPINLTNGYGRAHNIFFEVIKKDSKCFDHNEKLLLSAFNRLTKTNGFYSKVLGKKGDPELLTMGNYFYYAPIAAHRAPDGINFVPLKARDTGIYIVRRMTATESPNYFSTTDFRTFSKLSDLHPEKDYNWLTTELHTWRSLDGTLIQGILYKPENFDSQKRYPIIFHYYEIKSNGLNAFLKPQSSNGELNIPWFVSNGYLVFTPDVHFKIGEPGPSAYNSVISAVAYISKMPFVNTKKMGLQGISFGGFLTNYLVTHTHLFAAACSSVGPSDLIHLYGSLEDVMSGSSFQAYTEVGQQRMGATLWQKPDEYIRNSPIFYADKVTTPLLMLYGKNDALNFVQGVEFFTALRRLGKKAWMLEYDDGGHGVYGKSANDFSVRMKQFFNHYLKDSLPPIWMTRGIPAKMKGIYDGLELDDNIISPGAGLLINKPRTTSQKK